MSLAYTRNLNQLKIVGITFGIGGEIPPPPATRLGPMNPHQLHRLKAGPVYGDYRQVENRG